ncbi:MAG: MarR family transcriptional regulator [Bacteroidales bacterium]|nr:MarR family transcriptional regulator [Bacteroidales bacterium]MBQ1731395.1 MarR family transcriptional regulator [Bacteroidales bacterium]MBQ2350956.1 MarR family transcriptional regulator [Bacteroidales bacterium]MBQ2541728.1 MarR family transcriptional regulator [Bacteroidales bacterium]MBQ2575146.1 MarR family transcriptional regulator [Bacteroidales bacterium]
MNKHYGGTLISQIKQLQDRVFNRILKEEGIFEFNGPQGRILFALWKDEKMSLIELSQKTSLAKTTLSAMVERMKKDDLVIVEESQGDRRSILIQLSAKTLSLEEKFNRATKRITDIFYRGFDEEKATELDRLLNIIKENLKNE